MCAIVAIPLAGVWLSYAYARPRFIRTGQQKAHSHAWQSMFSNAVCANLPNVGSTVADLAQGFLPLTQFVPGDRTHLFSGY